MVSKLVEHLKDGVVTLDYTKADGTERRMICTKQMEYVPEEHIPSGEHPSPENAEEQLWVVWDIEKNAWRKIYEKNVKPGWKSTSMLIDEYNRRDEMEIIFTPEE